MLVQFRLKNFMSVRDEQVFSLVAANGLREKDDALADNVVTVSDQLDLVKTAVVYGANASGKSNLLKAINFLVNALTETPSTGAAVDDYKPFLLNRQSADAPTLLEAVFLIDETHYRYGFEVSNQLVISEWLYILRKQENVIFDRHQDTLRIGRAYSKLRELHSKEMINDASLLLNLGALFNDDNCLQVKKWANQIKYYHPIQELGYMLSPLLSVGDSDITADYLRYPEGKERVLQLLQVADVGIDDIEIVEEKSFWGNILRNKELPPVTKPTVQTIRSVWDEVDKKFHSVAMPLMYFESEGTRKLFNLIGLILSILDNGGILIADELDTKLHPLLTQRIVQLFNSPVTNPRSAQFIFATHDTNLLSAGLFRRDQIWFTEKDAKGGTEIYALTDYKPGGKTVRNDEQLEKNYIAGKYGGIPFLGNFDALFDPQPSVSETIAHE